MSNQNSENKNVEVVEVEASKFEAGPRILRLLNVVPVDLAELLAEIESESEVEN